MRGWEGSSNSRQAVLARGELYFMERHGTSVERRLSDAHYTGERWGTLEKVGEGFQTNRDDVQNIQREPPRCWIMMGTGQP